MTPLSVSTMRFPAASRTTPTGPSIAAAVGETLLGGALPATVEMVFCPYATLPSNNNSDAKNVRTKYRSTRLFGLLTETLLDSCRQTCSCSRRNLTCESAEVVKGQRCNWGKKQDKSSNPAALRVKR